MYLFYTKKKQRHKKKLTFAFVCFTFSNSYYGFYMIAINKILGRFANKNSFGPLLGGCCGFTYILQYLLYKTQVLVVVSEVLVKIYKSLTAPVEPLLLENWPY